MPPDQDLDIENKETETLDDESTDFDADDPRVKKLIDTQVAGLRANRDKLKSEKIQLQNRLNQLNGVVESLGGDDGLNELLNLREKLAHDEELALFAKGDREQYNKRITQRIVNDYDKRLEKANTDLSALNEKVSTYQRRINNEIVVNKLMNELSNIESFIPEMAKYLAHDALEVFKWDEEQDKIVAINPDTGEKEFSPDGEMTMRYWIENIAREKHPAMFKALGGSGGNNDGRATSRPSKPRSQMTPKESSDFIAKYGQKAYLDLPRN